MALTLQRINEASMQDSARLSAQDICDINNAS